MLMWVGYPVCVACSVIEGSTCLCGPAAKCNCSCNTLAAGSLPEAVASISSSLRFVDVQGNTLLCGNASLHPLTSLKAGDTSIGTDCPPELIAAQDGSDGMGAKIGNMPVGALVGGCRSVVGACPYIASVSSNVMVGK